MNHAQEAIDWIDYSSNLNPDVDNKAPHAAQLAQVHATLALVDQQRISNLIALARLESENQSTPTDALKTLYDTTDTTALKTRPEIAAALKIGDQK